jgi:hypothetical protein
MRNKYVAALIASLVAVVLVSCTEVPAKSMGEPIRLRVNAEPKFHAMRYAALPSGMQMTVLWTTEDLRAKLKVEFPALASDHAYLSLVQEQLISSEDTPYRRISFSFDDGATTTMHGPCGQSIFMWFNSAGRLSGTYVAPVSCPL